MMVCICGRKIISGRKNSDGEILCRRCNSARRNAKYRKTDKCKASYKKFYAKHGYKHQNAYSRTEAGKKTAKRYRQSEKGKIVAITKSRKRYWADPEYYRKQALKRIHGIKDYLLDDKCALCGSTENLSLDHMHPQVRNGKGTDDNLWTLCISCNSFKGARLITPGGAVLIGV